MRTGWKIFWIVCGVALAIGFACCAVALGLGVTLDSIGERFPYGIGLVDSDMRRAENIHESYEGITKINAELFAGDVSVLATDGNKILVDTDDLSQKLGFKCYAEGDELRLRTAKKIFHVNDAGIGTIKVYVPKKRLKEVSFEIGAGTLYIEDIRSDEFSVDVGAGEVDIDCFKAGEAELKCGAGSICAAGDVDYQIEIACGVGEIQYTASGYEKEYNYDIECAVGRVACGESEYSGLNGDRKIDNGARKEMEISTGVGSVIIDFDEADTSYNTETEHETYYEDDETENYHETESYHETETHRETEVHDSEHE